MKLIEEKAWRRLKKNKSAMFGMLVIIISVLVSLFAYLVSPDYTSMGNNQILQLETHPPRFSCKILQIRKQATIEPTSFFERLINGVGNPFLEIPILDYHFEGDSIFYTAYNGTAFKPSKGSYSIHRILYGEDRKYVSSPEQIKMHKEIEEKQIIERSYLLGTDKFGRDIFSRLLIGTRVSLSVGFVSVIISLLIGIFVGAIAGYFRGWVDQVVMWVINVFWAIPTILLAMCLYIVAGDYFENKLMLIFIAVGLTMWVDVARIVRGQFLLITELEFVTAARSLGFSHLRTIFNHILPNTLAPVIVVACANFANAILVESGLSYIGLGIQPPAPSWGSMLNEYKGFIDTDKAYLAIYPGLAIMILVLAFNLLGNGLRDALDVKGKV